VSGGNDMTQVERAANLGDAVGQLFVSRYFKPEARALSPEEFSRFQELWVRTLQPRLAR
jgi:predicted metalloendopeptidase